MRKTPKHNPLHTIPESQAADVGSPPPSAPGIRDLSVPGPTAVGPGGALRAACGPLERPLPVPYRRRAGRRLSNSELRRLAEYAAQDALAVTRTCPIGCIRLHPTKAEYAAALLQLWEDAAERDRQQAQAQKGGRRPC